MYLNSVEVVINKYIWMSRITIIIFEWKWFTEEKESKYENIKESYGKSSL